jgi:hypothetical protein
MPFSFLLVVVFSPFLVRAEGECLQSLWVVAVGISFIPRWSYYESESGIHCGQSSVKISASILRENSKAFLS